MEVRHLDDPVLLGVYGLMILTGLIDCFWGFRAFRYALGLLLGLVGLGLGSYAAFHFGDNSWTLSLVGGVAGLILGMVLAMAFFKAALIVAGALMGYAILAPLIGDFEPWLQLIVLVLGCGLFGFAAVAVATYGIMAGTAITGAFRIVYGSWYLFLGGPAVLSVGMNEAAGWHLLASAREPFIAMILLAGVGFACQFLSHRKAGGKKDGKD